MVSPCNLGHSVDASVVLQWRACSFINNLQSVVSAHSPGHIIAASVVSRRQARSFLSLSIPCDISVRPKPVYCCIGRSSVACVSIHHQPMARGISIKSRSPHRHIGSVSVANAFISRSTFSGISVQSKPRHCDISRCLGGR